MNRKDRFLSELDGKGKVLSALLSVLTLFAVLGVIAPGLYEQMPKYTEWICGLTTWSAYNKQADLYIVQSAMLGLPVLFLAIAFLYVLWKRVMAKQEQRAGVIFVTTYTVVLCMFYRGDANALSWLLIWITLFAGYFYLGKRSRVEQFGKLVVDAVMCMLALEAGVLFLNGFFASTGTFWKEISAAVPIVGAVVFAVLVLNEKCGKKAELLLELQCLLPLAWIGCFHFRYRYEKDGSLLELFASGRWKWMCVLLCVLFLVLCIWERAKRGRRLLFSTYAMTAVLRIFSQPEGLLNIDYFHNGEITMPMQQLVSFGKLPYVDIIPIHGLCDYYYGVVNYLFFDGTYISLNAAKVAGDLLMAVFLASVIYFFVEDQRQSFAVIYLFMPFMILSAGMRYWFLFVLFFTLFSLRMQKGMQSLYMWVWLSMLAIAWNASIGGATALAFLPVIVYRLWRDFPAQWKELRSCANKKKSVLTVIGWFGLALAGLAFLPLFLQIVGYLRENAGTTLYVNGMEMLEEISGAAGYFVPSVINGQGNFFLHTFAFLIPLLVVFVLMLQRTCIGAGEMFVTYLLAFWVLVNYAFVRYDEGLRTKVLGIFFLMLTAVTLLQRMGKDSMQILCAAMLGGAILMAGTEPVVTDKSLVLEKEIPEYISTTIMGQEIEDPVVHVSGELVSMPNLGIGFIQGNTLVSLQNVNTLVQAARESGQTVFDITNAVANAVTLDMSVYLPYSSAYNISNEVMQDKAIALLSEKLPDVILAAPEIRFDDAPFSFRSMKLYRYLMQQDYVPYKYENVIYLVRGVNPLPQAKQDAEAFAQLMHKKDLSYLPAVWGANAGHMSEPLSPVTIPYEIETTDWGLRVIFKQPVSGEELAMIGISDIVMEEKTEGTVLMSMPSSIASEGEVQFTFNCKGTEYLIPLCCSPYVTEEKSIAYIDFSMEQAEMAEMEKIAIHFYTW